MIKNNVKTLIHDNENYEFTVDNLVHKSNIKAHPKFEKFLNIARDMSEISNFYRYRLGAILVIKGRIVARGYNEAKSHPLQKRYNIERTNIYDAAPHYRHAEMDVLRKIKKLDLDFKNAELFVYHINTKGEQKMARPCAACMKAIKSHGIGVIHYSTTDGFATEYISQEKMMHVKNSRSPI